MLTWVLLAGVFVAFGAFVMLAYRRQWHWTGLPAAPVGSIGEDRPAKTLWDWLQLLGIPVALAALAFLLNDSQTRREQRREDERVTQQRRVAVDADREHTLRTFFTQMSDLMLDRHLLRSRPGDVVRQVGRITTLTALTRLDRPRRDRVLEFLLEGGLLRSKPLTNDLSPTAVLDVGSADFEQADLRKSFLVAQDLGGADLSRADLREAFISASNLDNSDLTRADLTGADLRAKPILIPGRSRRHPKTRVISVKLEGANLTRANLTRAKLNGADLGATKLIRANLTGAKLKRARLSFADLTRADLSGTDLTGARLDVAVLTGADLTGADLTGTDLTGTDLTGTDLRGARGVNMRGSHGKPIHGP